MKLNEPQKDNIFFRFVSGKKTFINEWVAKKVSNQYVSRCLATASKNLTGERGEPDFIYINEKQQLLILLENKDSISLHSGENKNENIKKYAENGIKHYLSFFVNFKNINDAKYFENWKILGIALSGNIEHQLNHKITTFAIKNGKIENINKSEILDEEDYINLFDNYNTEIIVTQISTASKEINNLLRNVNADRKAILLSALMICLYKSDNDFYRSFIQYEAKTIINNIPHVVETVLENEGIQKDKINIFIKEITSALHEKDLEDGGLNILKNILVKIKDNVIPLFKTKTHYDIIGKFYEEFLRYAGVANVKKGIVLTPHHISQLFTEIIDIKYNDVIFDPCCGTGAFLISGMNAICNQIEASAMNNKKELLSNVKSSQLIGVEKNTTMFCLAISNMLFRGDGKSKIHNDDFFKINKEEIFKNIKPTIGFINPPYAGKDNNKNHTKKEIQFLEELLGICSKYVVIIAPLSTYFSDDNIRARILQYHTLRCVINMPTDLFQPNATTHTAIAVFETNTPHTQDKEVIFYDLKDDGFVLSKNRGRVDTYNRWYKIKKGLLEKIKNPDKYNDGINLVKTTIKPNDEWIMQAHSKTDYSTLSENDFINSIKEYVIFKTKQEMGILDNEYNELELLEILNSGNIKYQNI